MRLIVGGSRTFNNYPLLKQKLDLLTSKLDRTRLTIVSGGASGADKLAEQWAFERMVKSEVFHARWRELGKKAGILRNTEMVDSCDPKKDAAVFFWNKTSTGTADAIGKARRRGLRVRVILF